MKLNIKPSDIKTVRVLVRTRGGSAKHATITFPLELVRRHGIKDKEDIVIGYLCRANENLEECD